MMSDVDPWVESMRRAEELRLALEKLAGLQAGSGASSGGMDARQIADELERLYQSGTRNYSWMNRR
jgi:hypothetical protein